MKEIDAMTNKEKYREFCKKEKNIPIFSKDWWLDSVCPENKYWDVVLVEKGGQIVASMPYIIGKKYCFRTIEMPMLTQKLGPFIKYPDKQKYDTKLSYEKETMTELIERLPSVDYFSQNFNYEINNWLPFYWKGFNQDSRYTYVIDDINNAEKVWSNISSKTKNVIRKAEKAVNSFTSDDLSLFYKINSMSFERQNIQIPYSFYFLEKLDNALKQNNCRQMFFAKDGQNRIHAAIYLIWDDISAYYLMGGGNPELRNSGATSLLIWEAIKFASNKTQKFDFEGSMLPLVEPFFRSFGAVQKSYFNISKINSKSYKLLKLSKETLLTIRSR